MSCSKPLTIVYKISCPDFTSTTASVIFLSLISMYKQKSPSTLKRDKLRMTIYYLKKTCKVLQTKVLTKLSSLSNSTISTTSIPPKHIYHPAIHNACQSMFQKSPYLLSPEEIDKFKIHRKWKTENGNPFESDLVYLPSGGMRQCLHCDQLT